MKFNLKNYKLKQIKEYVKKERFFFIYNISNLNYENQLKIDQTFYNNNLKCLKVYNTISKSLLKQSIFKNTETIINGSIGFVTFKDDKIVLNSLKKLLKPHPTMDLLGVRLNNKVYSVNQLKNLTTLSLKKNMGIFNKSLTKLLKNPYYRLKK